jgi:hypothetical protein
MPIVERARLPALIGGFLGGLLFLRSLDASGTGSLIGFLNLMDAL